MPKQVVASLDEIFSKRQFSVKSGPKGDMLTKLYQAPASWNDEERSAKFVMSAQVKDRYGDIVVAKGGDLTDFNANPVVLWAHDSRSAPIGMWSDVKAISGTPKRVEGKANLAPLETTDKADEVSRLLAAGMVRACSIGFMIKDWEPVDKDDPWGGWQFNEWELLECSICSVPANPLALVKAAGGDMSALLHVIELTLDQWAMTPAGTIVPRSAYEKAYQIVKNEASPTLVEVRSIDEVVEEPAPVVETPVKDKDLAERIIEGVGAIISKALGKKEEPEIETPVDKTKELTSASIVELNVAADLVVAEAVAEQEAVEKQRKAEEEAAAQEELELRARALSLAE